MKITIAISTYLSRNDPLVADRLHVTLTSLLSSGFPGRIIVVDDGSPVLRDWNAPVFKNVEVIIRKTNGGISRCKNTCILESIKKEFDIGFLADDDLIFHPDWWGLYCNAIRRTKYPHFCWGDQTKYTSAFTLNGLAILKTHSLNGCLMTYTKKVVDKIGGMPVSDSKWGFDHVPWSNRISREFFPSMRGQGFDVIGSNNFVQLQDAPSAIPLEERRKNKYIKFHEGGRVYLPLED